MMSAAGHFSNRPEIKRSELARKQEITDLSTVSRETGETLLSPTDLIGGVRTCRWLTSARP
jgi:hypothetical protein